jgi:hypothetical protein
LIPGKTPFLKTLFLRGNLYLTETGSRDKGTPTLVDLGKPGQVKNERDLQMSINMNHIGVNRKGYYYYCYSNGIVRL